ncbi:hypothetical protein ABQ333_04865 [Serratia fonticola]|uniref:hypothetical protein n=1 Tax=Serratia fonticola TaxID=47917 RepID=UPI003AAC190B
MNKFEALKALADEIAPGYRQKWGCEDGINDDSISVGTYNDDGDICPFIEVSISDWSGNDDDNEKLAKFITLANPPVVSELLAALEEKGQEVNQLKSDYQKLAQEHRFLANESARKGVRNAELEQRLQQPIKLPVDFDWSGDGDYVMTANEVRDAIKDAGYQVEGE